MVLAPLLFLAGAFAVLLVAVVLGVEGVLDVRERAGVFSEPGCSGFMGAKME